MKWNNLRVNTLLNLLLPVVCLFISQQVNAQLSSCTPNVPYHFIDLTGDPVGSWISPNHSREGQCCGANSPDVCTSFEILLDTQSVALNFDIYSGSIPPGSMYYQIDCGPVTPVGNQICISGPGPHRITFCKPGNNPNEYIIRAIAQPIFPVDDTVRNGCSGTLEVLGLDASTVTWNSVYPGTDGEYNYLLSCDNGCTSTEFTPEPNSPEYIDYMICGFPTADECGYTEEVCDTIRVYVLDSLLATVNPNPASFCQYGDSSGVLLTASASGGDGNYLYTWTDTSGTIVGTDDVYFASSQQAFTLEVKDGLYGNSCNAYYITVPVSERLLPIVDAGADQIICANDPYTEVAWSITNASEGTWSGGNGSFSPDSTKQIVAYTPTSSEIESSSVALILTTDIAGCPAVSDTVTINYSPAPDIQLTDTTVACYGDQIVFGPAVSGGAPPYTYQWSNGAEDSTITAGAGTYCVSVTDTLGCISSDCATISQPAALAVAMSSTDISVDGGSDGTATASPYGGTTPYTYDWINGEQTATITGLSYGIYTVTVTDSSGCQIQGSVVVSEPRCSGLEASAPGYMLDCYGDANGTTTVEVTGGLAPYLFQWNDEWSQTTATVTGLSAGNYMVTITDSSICHNIVHDVLVQQPDQISNSMLHTDVTTIGGSDGSATANPSGGNGGYAYLWSTGSTDQSITDLFSGVYYLTITDSKNCSLIDSVRINEPGCENLKVFVYGENVSCNGGSDGSASVFIFGGTPPYAVKWSNGDTLEAVSGLSAGIYTVEITDSLNCSVFRMVVISEPDALTVGAAVTDISCYGAKNGSIDLVVSGGTYPYFYYWSNGSYAEDQINLAAGKYTVTVTDDNSCSISLSATITEPSPIAVSYDTEDVSCFGGSDGSVELTVSGGTGAYSYLWNDNVTLKDRYGLPAGLYWVKVTDGNGCETDPISILIEEPDPLSATLSVTSSQNGYDISCHGASDGSIETEVSGGTAPYNFLWSNGSQDKDQDGLTAGTYLLTVTDDMGCSTEESITLTEPDILVAEIQVTSDYNGYDVSCYNAADGSITLAATGGSGNYIYTWENGSNSESQDDIKPATYVVTVSDENGCEASDTITLTAPEQMQVNITYEHATCSDSSNGSAMANVNGGVEDYTYQWSNGSTANPLASLSAGDYTVTVTDANGCTTESTAGVAEESSLVLESNISHVSCYGNEDGEAQLEAEGGLAPYSITWNNGGNSEFLTGVSAGTYTATVTDANECVEYHTITVDQPEPLNVEINSPKYDNGHHISAYQGDDGRIELDIQGGTPPYHYEWSNGMNNQDQENLTAGTYAVQVTDGNGCVWFKTIELTQPIDLDMPTAISPNGDGRNDFFVVKGIEVYPDNKISIFNRWGNQVYSKQGYQNEWNGSNDKGEQLPAGTYFVVLAINDGEINLTGYVELQRR